MCMSVQADQRVLKDFLLEKLPRLAAHFEAHSIDVSLITFTWFLVVFVECLPSDILLPLWDAFLYEGTKVNNSSSIEKSKHLNICFQKKKDLGQHSGTNKVAWQSAGVNSLVTWVFR